MDNLEFKTLDELYKFICDNRMSYGRIIKAYNKELYNKIISSYKNVKNTAESFWLYCHGYTDTLKCKCGKKLLFTDIIHGYMAIRCRPCMIEYRKNNSLIVKTLEEQQNSDRPFCQNPNCETDPITGDRQKVMDNGNGVWSSYCSIKCRGQGNSLLSRSKFAATCKKRYGVGHHRQDEEKFNEFVQSIQEKYGVDNIIDIPGAADKRDETNKELYGYENVLSSPAIQQQIKETNKERFGVENPSQSPIIHAKKVKNSYKSKEYIFDNEILYTQGYESDIIDHLRKLYKREQFGFIFEGIPYYLNNEDHVYHPDFKLLNVICEIKSEYTLNKNKEMNIAKFTHSANLGDFFLFVKIDNNIFSSVRNSNVNKLFNDLKIYGFDQCCVHDGKFFDFLNHELKIAIRIVDPRIHNEHLQNRNFFKDNEISDINCLYFNLQDVNTKYNIVLNSIINKIHKNTTYLHARKCKIKEINKNLAFEFLNKTHIQGHTNSNKYIGLYNGNDLVACMSFSLPREEFDKNNGYFVLSRFSTNIRIPGAASKLLSYFVKTYNPKGIISYSDNMYSNGNLYKQLGFTLKVDRRPDYKYSKISEYELIHKTNFAVNKIKKKYKDIEIINERQVTFDLGYVRTYDCGKKTWVLDLGNNNAK